MVKGPARPVPAGPGGAAAATAAAAIAPHAVLHISTTSWAAGVAIHRIHQDAYGALQFNPGLRGNARFSPITDAAGQPIPTLYGGSTFECAAMETVFHDVAYAPGFKTYDKGRLDGQIHSEVVPGADLLLADLGSKALRKLGVQRRQLIDTEKDQYPTTRLWAAAIHAQWPQVQGLCWTSRQDDAARSVVLFGDRIGAGVLEQVGPSRSLVHHAVAYGELLDLAVVIGLHIVPGRTGLP